MVKHFTLLLLAFGIYATNAQKPVAGFVVTPDTICEGDIVSFTDQSTNNPVSWQWSFPGAIPSGSTDQNPLYVFYTTPGIHNATLVVSNSGGSDSITRSVTVKPAPPTPMITQSHDTLFCSTNPSYVFYIWYDSTTYVSSGPADTFLVTTGPGAYNVGVVNEKCCAIFTGLPIILSRMQTDSPSPNSATGSPCSYFSVGLQNNSNEKSVLLYPDPASNNITIRDYGLKIKSVKIYSVMGMCLSSQNISEDSVIDISLLHSGIYFAELQNENHKWVRKFIKQ